MSIASLANDEILRTDRRSLDLRPIIAANLNPVIATLGLDNAAATQLRTAMQPVAAASPVQPTPASSALDGLVKYIPTETITLYVAATAAIASITAAFPWLTADRLYWGFVGLTPILFLLVYMGKRRSQDLPVLPQQLIQWPWWKLIACTVAFAFWALAVPPLVATEGGKFVAAFGALFISTMLSLIGAVVEPAPAPAPTPP
jgi:hypothetical protein